MEWDAHAIMYIAIGAFFVLFGLGIAFAFFRLGTALSRLSGILGKADTQVLPLLTRLVATLDGVNSELGKVDQITGSVAGIVKTAETTTLAVQGAVAKPIGKVAGLAAGVAAGVKSFTNRRRKER